MAPTPPPAAATVSRRALLGATALAGLAAAVGCNVSDPRIEGSGSATSATGAPSGKEGPTAAPTPTASPTMPGSSEAARAEDAVAALAAALLASKAALTSPQRRVVTAVRDAHRLHAAVLRTPDPTARTTDGATAASSPARPTKVSLDALIAAEKSLAARHAKLVPSARGLTALLFGSLSVAAASYAAAVGVKGTVPITPTPADPALPEVLDDVAGLQAVVAQLHAMIYGYQVAIGRLPFGKSRDRALVGLAERRALRDQLTSVLLARKASVPAAEPAYVPSVTVRNSATAGQLIAKLETAFVPFTGQWLASAAQPADQQLAWASMRRAASLARTWGGPISTWPGWPA